MRVGVVGAGISGLCVATELSRHGHDVDVLEGRDHFGGRAATVDGVEHCSRIMMDDYSQLRSILERVPTATPGRSIWQTLVPVKRMVHLERRGWVSLASVYALRGAGLSLSERYELARARRRRPLLARELRPGPLALLRMAAQVSPATWARVANATLRVRSAYAFPGATDRYLIDPWVQHLRGAGVELLAATRVERLRPRDGKAELNHSGKWHRYDAVVVTAFVPDTGRLLEASGIRHQARVSDLGILNGATATFLIDAREELATRHEGCEHETYLYSGGGFYAMYQPGPRRVVAVTTRPGQPGPPALLRAAQQLLRLRHPIDLIGTRSNQEPADGIYSATPLDPNRIAPGIGPVNFAGCYLSRTYPLDSGEAAARSASAVAQRLLTGP
jgi:glycine/D-amino acid oxidase-like deaminating enzyme